LEENEFEVISMAIRSVALSHLVEEFNLEPIHQSSDYDKIQITVEDANRPGLQLSGFYDHFEPARLQIMGLVEHTFLSGKTSEERFVTFDRFFSYKPPALIIARGIEPLEECLVMARKHDITLLRSEETTSYILSTLIAALKVFLAPCITRHGVLVEVYGEGLLLMGESGVGKSEAAIELVKRGHRLIADDAVEIKKSTAKSLIGSAPELIRHYIELRGIGVINVAKLFGIGSVKDSTNIDMIINIETWHDGMMYDRLGIDSQFTNILGVQIPSLTIPVKPGRNLAVILEVAAMNNRQKKMGYNNAIEFTEQINKHFDESMNNPF
jgi:HPr kinase/phosphorylase